MPVSTSSPSLLASLPSFMSVFGNGPSRPEVNETNGAVAQSPTRIHSKRPQHFSSPFARRDSASTYESTESSPTTTISTLESSLTEPSPQTPPESPDSSLALSSFQYLRTQSVPGLGIMDQERKEHFSASFPTPPASERGDSPNKKMRNMKNLSVNTTASNRHGAQLPKLGLSNQSSGSHAFSAPPTPAFIVPPKMPRKKPSSLGLIITTPETTSNGQAAHERPSAVPQTPSDHQIRTLRALQTSTNGPLFSPTVAPEGGMRLPPIINPATSARLGKCRPPLSVSAQTSFDDATTSPITRQTLDHVQEETDYDLPLSQEVKSPAYPQGPVCIYDPYVYLYLEPSHIEAREFDVVLNVAREVKNPFTFPADPPPEPEKEDAELQTAPGLENDRLAGRDGLLQPELPEQEEPSKSVDDAHVEEDKGETVPTTPKATRPEPEYVHVPWDHNTNVVDDLLKLCELIDSRARQERRVLVHCQCGVSRSASLVVAYGIYKNPQLTVQEAYDAVKNRSRWIGPNMNLIYQLSEFKTKLSKLHPTGTSAWHLWRNNMNVGHTDSASAQDGDSRSEITSSLRTTPQMSISVSQHNNEPSISRANSFSPPGSAQLVQTTKIGGISPGPSSAPPGMHFPQDGAPTEFMDSVKTVDKNVAPKSLHPPTFMDVEPGWTLNSSVAGQEAIEQKEIGPTGAVAHDLQEVAKDLDTNDQSLAPTSALEKMDIDHGAVFALPLTSQIAMGIDTGEPVSPRTVILPLKGKEVVPVPNQNNVSPTLPAGFSSLLSRRQGPPAPRQLPFRQELPKLVPVQLPQRTFDPDVPPTPSLLSPRAAEFTASPFHRTAAGDLAGSSVFEQGLMSPKTQEEDPRSPAQRGEAPITRSIFDMI